MSESELLKKIAGDINAAVKNKDMFTVKVLRFLKSYLDSAAKDKCAELAEEEIVAIIRRRIKQGKESRAEYEKGGRSDLAEAEGKETAMLEKYLPASLSDAELREMVAAAVEKTKAAGPSDFGKVMGLVMKQVAGKADGQTVKAAVERALSGNKE